MTSANIVTTAVYAIYTPFDVTSTSEKTITRLLKRCFYPYEEREINLCKEKDRDTLCSPFLLLLANYRHSKRNNNFQCNPRAFFKIQLTVTFL